MLYVSTVLRLCEHTNITMYTTFCSLSFISQLIWEEYPLSSIFLNAVLFILVRFTTKKQITKEEILEFRITMKQMNQRWMLRVWMMMQKKLQMISLQELKILVDCYIWELRASRTFLPIMVRSFQLIQKAKRRPQNFRALWPRKAWQRYEMSKILMSRLKMRRLMMAITEHQLEYLEVQPRVLRMIPTNILTMSKGMSSRNLMEEQRAKATHVQNHFSITLGVLIKVQTSDANVCDFKSLMVRSLSLFSSLVNLVKFCWVILRSFQIFQIIIQSTIPLSIPVLVPSYYMIQKQALGIPPLKLLYWELLVGLFTFYVFTEIGFVSFLQETKSHLNNSLYALDGITLLIYSIDLYVSFKKGYYYKGELILDLRLIRKRYLGWRFAMDIVTIAGVTLTLFPQLRLNGIRMIVFWKFYSLNELDNLIFRIVSKYRGLYKFTNFIKLSILYFLFCHYVACIFYAIDLALLQSDYYGENKYTYLWVYTQQLFSPIISLDWTLQYMYAMYYSVETFTTIAYGDCTPKNPVETIFVTFLLVMSTVVFAYIIQELVVILMSSTNIVRFQYLNQVFAIYRYLQLKKVPLQLKYRVKTIYQYLWYEQRFLKSSELSTVIKKLPQKLEGKLISEVFKVYCKRVEFFNSIPDSFYSFMIKIIDERIVLEGSQLFRPHDYDSCSLFFMEQGNAQYYYKYSKESAKEISLRSISFAAFGEVEFFTGMARELGARVCTQNVLYELKRKQFVADLKANSLDNYQKYCMRAHQLLTNRSCHIFRYCQTCLQKDHWIIRCPKVHYIVDKDQLIHFRNQMQNKRKKFKRVKRRLFTQRTGIDPEIRRQETKRNERNNLKVAIKNFERYLNEYKAVNEENNFYESVYLCEKYFPQHNLLLSDS